MDNNPESVAEIAKQTKAAIVDETKQMIDTTVAEIEAKHAKEIKDLQAQSIKDKQEILSQIGGMAQNYNVSVKENTQTVKGFKSYRDAEIFGTWFKGLYFDNYREEALKYIDEKYGVKTLYASNNNDGGIFVPTEISYAIIDHLEQFGDYSKFGMTVNMGSDVLKYPKLTSELTGYWGDEVTETTESDPSFGQVEIHAKDLHVLNNIHRNLLNDSAVNIAPIIANLMSRAIAAKIDDAVINGTGTSTYGGHVGALQALKNVDDTIANIKGLKVGSGNLWSELTTDDFRGTIAKLRTDFRQGATWKFHQAFYDQVVEKLILAANGVLPADLVNGTPLKFLGYPIEIIRKMPSTEANSQVCALFGNMNNAAYIGNRQSLQTETTNTHGTNFAKGVITTRGTVRVGYTVYGQGDTTNAGSYVGLITAAS